MKQLIQHNHQQIYIYICTLTHTMNPQKIIKYNAIINLLQKFVLRTTS